MKSVFLPISICLVLYLYKKTTTGKLLDNYIDDPDIHRNVSELITSKGYPVEEHTVQTVDGYLLSLIRIPFGRNSSKMKKDKGVVLLIHGLLADASAWVLNFPGQSLGFILPDAGYDVWLINARGSNYSKKHLKYRTNEYQFWNFSFDQIGQYDVSATIDYILDYTGRKNLCIVAHSQGAGGTLVMLSEMPNYKDKLKLIIALAPATYVGLVSSAIQILVPFANRIANALNVINAGEFLPNNSAVKSIKQQVCKLLPEFCVNVLHLTSLSKEQLNRTRLSVYFTHLISDTSTKSLLHYAQLVKSKTFRKYDYGDLNLKYYHQEEPPEYNLSYITTPVALIWSRNDTIVESEDVGILRRKLKSVVLNYCVPDTYYHNDYFLANNAPKLIYEPILKLLAQY